MRIPLVAAVCAALFACNGGSGGGQDVGDDGGIPGSEGVASASASAGGASTDAGAADGSTGDAAAIAEVRIEPADAVLEVVDGVPAAPLQFAAIVTYADGTEAAIDGTWNTDNLGIGGLDASQGEFLPSGLFGGVAEVSFGGPGELDATTSLTVKLRIVDDPEMVGDPIKDDFDGAVNPDPTLVWSYPEDGTVFPRGLGSPQLQWDGGAATDVYRLSIDAPTFAFETWRTLPAPSRYALPTLPKVVWDKLTGSVAPGDVTVSLQRHDGAQAYLPTTKQWRIADADLIGVIYYWEVNQGNVVRLRPGVDSAPEAFIQKPPGVECVACHSVSADGATLVASFQGGASPWGTFNAADGASLFASNSPSGFQAISPDGGHVMWGESADLPSLNLSTFDSVTPIAQLPVEGGFPVQPAWSPDGTRVAYSVRTDGNWLDFTQSSVWVAGVDLVTPGFTAPLQVAAPIANRSAAVFPSWSPDSNWVALGRATQARTRGAQGELWLSAADGSSEALLGRACGVGSLSEGQSSACYEPTFMPEERGGYFWLVFVSERRYGNTLVDEVVVTRRKQLWVTAIDADPVDGVDPSHPSFWLPGQELDNQNMRGAWALEPADVEG